MPHLRPTRQGGAAAPDPLPGLFVASFPSSGNWTPPAQFWSPEGTASAYDGFAWAGGGGGSGSLGGGGGEHRHSKNLAATPGVNVAVVVPAAASANTTASNVTIGGTTVVAVGGGSGGSGGAGGTGGTGTVGFAGGAGSASNGGGGAGTAGAGGTGGGTAAGGALEGGFCINAATGARLFGAGGGINAPGAPGRARIVYRAPVPAGFPRRVGFAYGRDTSDLTSRAATLPTDDDSGNPDNAFAVGDLIRVIVVSDGTATITISGYTGLTAQSQGQVVTQIFWRTATGSDAITINTSSAEQTVWLIERFKDHSGPPECTGTTASAANADSPSHTAASSSKALVSTIIGFDHSAFVNPLPPTNYTGLIVVPGNTAVSVMLAMADRMLETASTNPGAWTSESEQHCAITCFIPGQVVPGGALSPNVAQIGDSITQGSDGDADASNDKAWREDLYNLVVAEGYNVEFVGTRAHGLFSDNQHDGRPAMDIANRRALIAASYGAGNTYADGRLWLLLIGTNNVRDGSYVEATALAEYALLVGEMKAAWPQARIIAMTIPAIGPGDGTAAGRVAGFNTGLVAAWDAFDALYPDSPIIRIDANALIGAWTSTNFLDDYHLKPAGYALIIPAIIAAAEPIFALP